jgi:hypothetical protein
MVRHQIHELQQLQPEGACFLQGPPGPALDALRELRDNTLPPITMEWEAVWDRWTAAVGFLKGMMASSGNDGSNVAWGHQLQQLLRSAVPGQTAAALRDAGAAVCAEFPVKLCCNNRDVRLWPRLGRCCWAAAAAAARLRGTAARPARVQRGRRGTARCAGASPRQRQQMHRRQRQHSRVVLCVARVSRAGLFRPCSIPFKTICGGLNPGQVEQPRTGNPVKSRAWHRPERGDPDQKLNTKTGKPLKIGMCLPPKWLFSCRIALRGLCLCPQL